MVLFQNFFYRVESQNEVVAGRSIMKFKKSAVLSRQLASDGFFQLVNFTIGCRRTKALVQFGRQFIDFSFDSIKNRGQLRFRNLDLCFSFAWRF